MSGTIAALLFAAAWFLVRTPGTPLRRLPQPGEVSTPRSLASVVEDPRRRAMLCMVACSLVLATVVSPVLAVAGAPAGAVLSWWLGRFEAPSVIRARAEVERDLPISVDLLAACLLAGRPVDQALRAVGEAMGGPLHASFSAIEARLALGADPVDEWRRVEGEEPQLARLARSMARSLESGAPLVDSLSRLGVDLRRARRTALQLKARNVGVKSAAPLAACFLPAFMLIGVVPTVAGAFAHLVL